MDRDKIIAAVFTDMAGRYRCSTEDILCEPWLREEFLSNSRQQAGSDWDEGKLLKRLGSLRKQSKLPRSREVRPVLTLVTHSKE